MGASISLLLKKLSEEFFIIKYHDFNVSAFTQRLIARSHMPSFEGSVFTNLARRCCCCLRLIVFSSMSIVSGGKESGLKGLLKEKGFKSWGERIASNEGKEEYRRNLN